GVIFPTPPLSSSTAPRRTLSPSPHLKHLEHSLCLRLHTLNTLNTPSVLLSTCLFVLLSIHRSWSLCLSLSLSLLYPTCLCVCPPPPPLPNPTTALPLN